MFYPFFLVLLIPVQTELFTHYANTATLLSPTRENGVIYVTLNAALILEVLEKETFTITDGLRDLCKRVVKDEEFNQKSFIKCFRSHHSSKEGYIAYSGSSLHILNITEKQYLKLLANYDLPSKIFIVMAKAQRFWDAPRKLRKKNDLIGIKKNEKLNCYISIKSKINFPLK